MAKWVKAVASGLYVGYIPYLSGTAGSLEGVLIYIFISRLSWWIYSLILVVLLFLGEWVSSRAEEIFRERDSHKIIIDEVAGYLITMFLIPWNLKYVLAGFIFFRIFDIWKPFPIRRLQKLSRGKGVMIDDIVAGIYAHFLIILLKFTIIP